MKPKKTVQANKRRNSNLKYQIKECFFGSKVHYLFAIVRQNLPSLKVAITVVPKNFSRKETLFCSKELSSVFNSYKNLVVVKI